MIDLEALYQAVVDLRDQCDGILETIAAERFPDGDDFTPPGEFGDAVASVPNVPVPLNCGDAATHDPHLWTGYEPDGTTPVTYQCKGIPF